MKIRMLNYELATRSFQDADGGVLIQNVTLLAAGTWTDSNVRTPLRYTEDALRSSATNWRSNGIWTRHSGGAPRAITDKVGEVRNPRYEDGAVVGDLFFHMRTQNSRDVVDLIRTGGAQWVSVEHGGTEKRVSGGLEATSLEFYGLAIVDRGACEVCMIPRTNEGESEPPEVNDMNDEEIKQALADLKAEILAEVDAKLSAKPEEKKDEPSAEPSAEVSKLSAAFDSTVKELAIVKKENEGLSRRLEALEKRPNPKTLPEMERELEELVVPAGYSVGRN